MGPFPVTHRQGATVGRNPPHQLTPTGFRLAPTLEGRKVKVQHSLLSIAAAMVAAMSAAGAQEGSAILSPQALQEIALVEAEIDRIEAQMIERLAVPPDNQVQQVELLGKLMLYDKQLS